MKDKILKIAGVKSEAAFYKKFPTEAAFMKVHGKELKKAQVGANIPPINQNPYMYGNVDINGNPIINQAPINPNQVNLPRVNQQVGTPVDLDNIFKPKRKNEDVLLNTVTKSAGPVGKLIEGIDQLQEEKEAVKRAKQMNTVSDLYLAASRTRPEEDRRMYNRPEDMVINPNQRFPSYGTGTNPLARNGSMIGGNPTEIQNMYSDDDTIYTDLGYEPLNDSSKVKQFDAGGIVEILKKFGTAKAAGASGGGASASGASSSGTPSWQTIGSMGENLGQAAYQNNAGTKIGGTLGGAVGSIFGPAGKAVGQTIGTFAGGALDRNPRRIKAYEDAALRNVETMGMQQGIQGAMGQYSSFVKNGGNVPHAEDGWMSHNWNPQVIAKFGDMDVSEVQDYASDGLQSLRTGGHLRQNEQYAMGGEVQTHWGGEAETISQNPYLPNTGETIMFRGQSHDESDGQGNTGIGVTYGRGGDIEHSEADVEVERNEPAIELGDGLVVYGNLKIPKYALSAIGDPKAEGKKFKNYVADLSKKESVQNKLIDKATNELNDMKVLTPLDMTTFNAHKMMIDGANAKLKQYAEFKQNAAGVQSAINDTAEELGLDADALAKGKTKVDKKSDMYKAMFGKNVPKAQGGTTTPRNGERRVDNVGNTFVYDSETKNWVPDREWMAKYRPSTTTPAAAAPTTAAQQPTTVDPARYEELKKLYEEAKAESLDGKKKSTKTKKFQEKFHEYFPEFAQEVILSSPTGVTSKGKGKYKTIDDLKKAPIKNVLNTNVDEYFGERTRQYMSRLEKANTTPVTAATTPAATPAKTTSAPEKKSIPIVPAKQNKLAPLYNMVQPLLQRPLQEGLDPSQLYGEMYALSTNQQEPVQAVLYNPELDTPYDISLQDKLNANQADFNALQRMTGYNPAAQMALAAQKYSANSGVLGEQFRMNQALRAGVYDKNRDLINAAKIQNLGILDQQYTRQALAKSNTKATTLSALSSISDKIAKNRLENRQLATYSNMFPQYGFDRNMRARNQGLTFFQTPTVGNTEPVYDKKGNIVGYGPESADVAKTTTDQTTTTTTPETTTAITTTPVTTQKYGGITKKALRNGDILKSFKNL